MSYSGIWPVAPTPFNDDGTLDLEGMTRHQDLRERGRLVEYKVELAGRAVFVSHPPDSLHPAG